MKSQQYQTAGALVVSTTGNIDNLDTQGCALLRFTNASAATLRGLKAGFPGQRVRIIARGAGNVDLAHQNGGSSAANQLFNIVTSGVTSLSGGSGTAEYTYDDSISRWVLIQHEQGAWQTVAYNAGNFTASAGTWTLPSGAGNQFDYSFKIEGNSVRIRYNMFGTNVSNSGVSLFLAVPNGYTALITGAVPTCAASDHGAARVPSLTQNNASAATIQLFSTLTGGTFTATAGAGDTLVFGETNFQVN